MLVVDSQTSKEIAISPTVEGMDGVYFDAGHKRVYVSGGPRGIGMFSRISRKVRTSTKRSGRYHEVRCRSSFWSPELNRYYVAAPAQDNERGRDSRVRTRVLKLFNALLNCLGIKKL